MSKPTIPFKSWFPVFAEYLEGTSDLAVGFRELSPTTKLYYWLLVSEANARQSTFYRADAYFRAALGVSQSTLTRARRSLSALGLIQYKPGSRPHGKPIATTYLDVSFGVVLEEGTFWAPMHRYSFEVILASMRDKRFSSADAITYICLWFWWQKSGGKAEFFITKSQLMQITGLSDAVLSAKRLRDAFSFENGERLYECREDYRKLTITKWSWFIDPTENERNAKNAERYRADIEVRAMNLRAVRTPQMRLSSQAFIRAMLATATTYGLSVPEDTRTALQRVESAHRTPGTLVAWNKFCAEHGGQEQVGRTWRPVIRGSEIEVRHVRMFLNNTHPPAGG